MPSSTMRARSPERMPARRMLSSQRTGAQGPQGRSAGRAMRCLLIHSRLPGRPRAAARPPTASRPCSAVKPKLLAVQRLRREPTRRSGPVPRRRRPAPRSAPSRAGAPASTATRAARRAAAPRRDILGLVLEQLPAGHGDHPAAEAPLAQELRRLERDEHLRAGGDQDQLRVVVGLQDIAAARPRRPSAGALCGPAPAASAGSAPAPSACRRSSAIRHADPVSWRPPGGTRRGSGSPAAPPAARSAGGSGRPRPGRWSRG